MLKLMSRKKPLLPCERLKVSDITHSPSMILHHAIANIALDNFEVKSIAFFENPLTAIVHLENQGPRDDTLKRLELSTRRALKDVQHRFMITLKLTDLDHGEGLSELSYFIERKGSKNHQSDSITIEFANRLSAKIIGNIRNSGITIQNLKHAQ